MLLALENNLMLPHRFTYAPPTYFKEAYDGSLAQAQRLVALYPLYISLQMGNTLPTGNIIVQSPNGAIVAGTTPYYSLLPPGNNVSITPAATIILIDTAGVPLAISVAEFNKLYS